MLKALCAKAWHMKSGGWGRNARRLQNADGNAVVLASVVLIVLALPLGVSDSQATIEELRRAHAEH
jgi:hypothetical protein